MENSNIECAYCGETFFYELTRCPNCGQDVYPLDEDEVATLAAPEFDEVEPEAADVHGVHPDKPGPFDGLGERARPLGAVLFGWLVTLVPGVLLYFGLHRLVSPPAEAFLPPVGVVLAAFVGGYLAAALYPQRPQGAGFLTGMFGVLVPLLIFAVENDLASVSVLTPGNFVWWAAVIAGASAGGDIFRRQQRNLVVQQLFELPSEELLFDDLYVKVGHDADRVERLIEYERTQDPDAIRRVLIQNAIRRWERDNQ